MLKNACLSRALLPQFPYLPITGRAGQLAPLLRISIMSKSNIPGANLPVTLFHFPGRVNLLATMTESVAGQHPAQGQSLSPWFLQSMPLRWHLSFFLPGCLKHFNLFSPPPPPYLLWDKKMLFKKLAKSTWVLRRVFKILGGLINLTTYDTGMTHWRPVTESDVDILYTQDHPAFPLIVWKTNTASWKTKPRASSLFCIIPTVRMTSDSEGCFWKLALKAN